VADLQAQAWAELGNARRIANDPNGAEADLATALERARQGTEDPLLLARLMDLTASLYTAQRRFADAFQLLDWVFQIHEREGDAHSAGRALIKKGISCGYALDTEQAVRLFGQGLRLIEPLHDPKLVLSAVHSLIWFLVDGGRLEAASRLLVESRELYAVHAERLDRIKVHWVEGRIAAGIGDDDTAERAFLEVRRDYEEAELPYDAALVSLDLAALWLRGGRSSEIRSLIDETLAVFRARKIRREAIGALLMLREAFEKDRATVALLRNVASELQRLEREPARRARAE
jgi:tetratricopeptide (TPR) repeat protein